MAAVVWAATAMRLEAASDISWRGSGPACLLGKTVEKKVCFRVGEAASLSFERRRRSGESSRERKKSTIATTTTRNKKLGLLAKEMARHNNNKKYCNNQLVVLVEV